MVQINLRENTHSLLRRIGIGMHPSADVYESPDDYLLLVNLPGFEEEDIGVRFVGGEVEIHAEREPGREGYTAVREGRPTTVDETVPVPVGDGVEAEDAETAYENGVLSVRLPKVGTDGEDGPTEVEDEAGSETEGSEDDDTEDGEVEHPTSHEELEGMSYREMQKVAMDLGIKANQKKETLVDEIADELGL